MPLKTGRCTRLPLGTASICHNGASQRPFGKKLVCGVFVWMLAPFFGCYFFHHYYHLYLLSAPETTDVLSTGNPNLASGQNIWVIESAIFSLFLLQNILQHLLCRISSLFLLIVPFYFIFLYLFI